MGSTRGAPPLSYVCISHLWPPPPPWHPANLPPPRPAISPKTQEKDIFISMKNATRDAPFSCILATKLTIRCSTFLSAFFHDPRMVVLICQIP